MFQVKASLLAVAMAFPTFAMAAPVSISTQGSSVFGTNGSATVTINSIADPDVGPLNVRAGGFALTGDIDQNPATPAQNFVAFCLDISTYLSLPSNYSITSSPFVSDPLTATQVGNIQKLFDMAYGTLVLTDGKQSGGFQLALWEIIYETSGVLSLTAPGGNFSASNSAGAIGFANTLLDNLATTNAAHVWDLVFLESDYKKTGGAHYSQHLVTALPSPVPLPAAGLMLMAALGALGLARRRRA